MGKDCPILLGKSKILNSFGKDDRGRGEERGGSAVFKPKITFQHPHLVETGPMNIGREGTGGLKKE